MASPQQDLLHVLAREHRDHSVTFHELMEQTHTTASRHRRRQFASLVLHLGVHLQAEHLLVHPLVIPVLTNGEETLRDREREIMMVQDLIMHAGASLGDGEPLRKALRAASAEFTAHADREELEVYMRARHAAAPKQLRRMGRLHVTLQQRLPARYQRQASNPAEPWSDPHLWTTLSAWYAAELPPDEREPDREPGSPS